MECSECEGAILVSLDYKRDQCPNCRAIFDEDGNKDYDIIRDILNQ